MAWHADRSTEMRIAATGAVRSLIPPVGEGQQAVGGGSGDESLIADLVRVLALECEADDILVAIHDQDQEAAPLFFGGRHAGSGVVQRGLLAAAEDALIDQAGSAPEWRTIILSGEQTASVLTTSVVSDDATQRITVTALFEVLSETARGRARRAVAHLAPLVSPFFRLWQRRRHSASRLRGLTSAINHSDVGIVIVDRTGAIIFSNGVADSLIDARDGVRSTGKRLSASRLADTLRLQAAIAHVAATTRGVRTGMDDAPVLALPRAGRRALLVALVAAEEPDDDTVIVHLFDPEVDLTALVDPVCKHYGLSPVETRLARLLAGGISLGAAAEEMRVREQSARSYLKQIFLKTETRRQGELVWLLLRSSVRTGPTCSTSFVTPLKWG